MRSMVGVGDAGFSVAVLDGKGEIGWTRLSSSLEEW